MNNNNQINSKTIIRRKKVKATIECPLRYFGSFHKYPRTRTILNSLFASGK
jgi:hypothetical protein